MVLQVETIELHSFGHQQKVHVILRVSLNQSFGYNYATRGSRVFILWINILSDMMIPNLITFLVHPMFLRISVVGFCDSSPSFQTHFIGFQCVPRSTFATVPLPTITASNSYQGSEEEYEAYANPVSSIYFELLVSGHYQKLRKIAFFWGINVRPHARLGTRLFERNCQN